MYRILPNPAYSAPMFALAKRYSTLEGAFADMGTGIVVDDDQRMVAFHERHLDMLTRMANLGR